MKRKIAIISLLIIMVAALLTACGSGNENKKSTDSGNTAGAKQTLVIGIDDAFAPMGFRNENNEIVGFDIDMARKAAEYMGVEVKFQPIDWSTKEAELDSGRIDLIWNGYTITEERKEKVLFTKPYLKNAQVVVTLKDSPITKIDELAGKQVGIQALSSAVDALNAHPVSKKVSLNEYKDNILALTDLKAGRVEAVVLDKVVAEYYMTKEPGTFKMLEEALAPEEYAVGVKKGNEELLNKLQAALDKMVEDGTAAEISKKWFGEDVVLK